LYLCPQTIELDALIVPTGWVFVWFCFQVVVCVVFPYFEGEIVAAHFSIYPIWCAAILVALLVLRAHFVILV
jgi:hypothetical protein